jgi:hypothetical protein
MKVYISGKIGEEVISDATRQKFAKAEEMLKAKGYEVFNPCDEKWQRTLRRSYEKDRRSEEAWIDGTFPSFYAYALLRDLMVLSTKDAVYMLSDWKRSEGATAEYHFALATGKKILFQVEDHAFDYLKGELFVKSDAGQLDEHLMKAPWNEALSQYIHDNINEVWLPL